MAKKNFKLKNKNIRANTQKNFQPTNDVQQLTNKNNKY